MPSKATQQSKLADISASLEGSAAGTRKNAIDDSEHGSPMSANTQQPTAASSSASRPANQRSPSATFRKAAASHLGQMETSIWDWDTPLESVGESTSYYYEPQGELLQDHTPRDKTSEFTIPTVVGPQDSDPGEEKDGFLVPGRLTGRVATVAGSKRKSTGEDDSIGLTQHSAQKRLSRNMTEDSEIITPGSVNPGPAHTARSHSAAASRSIPGNAEARPRPVPSPSQSGRGVPPAPTRGQSEAATVVALPARKVFPIQIGDKLFRLSGASISSDAPSYFSQFFEEQLRQNEGAETLRTLYIDRDPATFEDISLHLQGYHIEPKDGPHFVRLFADAQFFSLPRLTAQLFASPIYIRIGDSEFQIPRDLFNNPGDSPNYFSLGFSIFFTTPTDVFPGLNKRTLLRPPSILPPSVPNKCAQTFADILHILKGYPVHIRNEEHRAELLRDARYYHLKGLEQRIIPHSISYNLGRAISEIVIPLTHIRASGISFVPDSAASTPSASGVSPTGSATSAPGLGPGWVYYQRPYVDSEAYCLILEIGGEESSILSIAPPSVSTSPRLARVTFHRETLGQMTKLLTLIANKMNLPITQPLGLMMMERGAGVASLPVSPGNSGLSEERVKVKIGSDAHVVLDGQPWHGANEEDDDDESMDVAPESPASTSKRRRTVDEEEDGEEWVVRKAQYRLRVQPESRGPQMGRSGMEIVLGAVKIEAISSERGRNEARGFVT
ncbi:hypothetical protein LTR78_001143 [Recurvomyces mirabilis]|uniref:Potassium channel tetramerisation-type BTB domain-containing protein n=1 Tax=Recurvomyces mirabilis TaxID=574656 RepID=A0AAE1C5E8_9PEZI|nr:hypothetical protein LTR78_001143 [Recurvomyces mirabilis]KAK5161119.1 hypothetical protein LTS14_000915 [Recurvomyces mirabilis]